MTGSLDSVGDFPLMLCTVASLSARTDFSIFVDKLTQQVSALIVNDQFWVSAEAAASGAEITLLSSPSFKFSHDTYSYFLSFSHEIAC